MSSGLAAVVRCGGTLAKAFFPGWRPCCRPPVIGPPSFLVRGAREGLANALIFEGSCKDAPPAVRCDFYVVLEALTSAHEEHLRSAQQKFWRRLGNCVKSSDLEGSINGPKKAEKEPQLC